ncbi:MAG: MFS transporter [Candidatus Eisenbacteria bacterium]|nr:MFS transporter [Candidatus Eisenbacteria bacterium]
MRLPHPDWLATRWGRIVAFFLLYVTEGIPLGFTATAIATQMRRQGLGPAEIGVFIGSLYVPWAWKWVAGPFVDTLASDRLGRRRMWIVGMQLGIVAVLLLATPVDFVENLSYFTTLILILNSFGAVQDVAIDALATQTLKEDERGIANGFMFAGASIGQAIGGSAVLYLAATMPFQNTYYFVAGSVLFITLFVGLGLREPKRPPRPEGEAHRSALQAIGGELSSFVKESLYAFFRTRGGFVGLLFAILPAGAYALGLALQANLAVELGLTDPQVASMNLWSTIIFAVFCVGGGWISDRLGRRLSLGIFLALTAVPTLWLAWVMQQDGWIWAVDTQMAGRPLPAAGLVTVFWIAVLAYNAISGLGYGVRTALFMDVTIPRVAATQFTAYMAMLNFAISYTATWQGHAIERWGYPKTLLIDSLVGLVSLALLPLMKKRPPEGELAGLAGVEAVAGTAR